MIFATIRKAVDRLKHINEEGVIPDFLKTKKDVAGVEETVYRLIQDGSAHKFDEALDDDPAYVKVMSHSHKLPKVFNYNRV